MPWALGPFAFSSPLASLARDAAGNLNGESMDEGRAVIFITPFSFIIIGHPYMYLVRKVNGGVWRVPIGSLI